MFDKISDRLSGTAEKDRGVSPVIGVILMVAITVILAAVIATFVMGMGDNVGDEPRAGVSFSQNGEDVTVTWNNEGNLDTDEGLEISADGCDTVDEDTIGSIGNTATVEDCDSDSTITVTGQTSDGTTGVVGQYTVE